MKKVISVLSTLAVAASMTSFAASAAESNTYKLGDVNMDGVVNSADLQLTKLGMLYLRPLSATQKKLADINGDRHVNLVDVVALTNHCLGRNTIDEEVTVYYDENGNVAEYLGGNDALKVDSNGYTAYVNNAVNDSVIGLSDYVFQHKSTDATTSVSPWCTELNYKGEIASTNVSNNDYYQSISTVENETGKTIGASRNAWGYIGFTHDYIAEETAPFMTKTYRYLKNANVNDALFSTTGYGVDETVGLVNAEVTKRENGIEFVNHVSDDTVNAFMADDYVTIDGVTISYKDGEFTVEGINEDEIELRHTMTVTVPRMGTFDEIAVVTNTPGQRYVYGLMYDTGSQSMAALVKVRLDKNAEATVIQYSKPSDMATTINFYPKDWVLEQAFANPDEMVTLFDNEYDPNRMVFQTVHFPRMTKNALIGAINARYQITNGFTYKQTAGNVTVAATHDQMSTTVAFNNANDNFTLENTTAGRKTGISSTDAAMTYTQGGESFTIAKADANRYYTPNSSVTYTYGEETSSFTPAEVLDLRTPTLY